MSNIFNTITDQGKSTGELPALPRRVLFIDRDGTLIKEAPPTYQIDSFDKLEFFPDMFYYLRKIADELDFELVMVSNQDGLGTEKYPEKNFREIQGFVIKSLQNEGIIFSKVCIDKSFPDDNLPTRKPGTAMLEEYIKDPSYDLPASFVIGDRGTDVQLARNLGCKAIWLNLDSELGAAEVPDSLEQLRKEVVALETTNWKTIYEYLKLPPRIIFHERVTNETSISITLNLDGAGKARITTGIGFFDHMLDQIAKHGNLDLFVTCKGDLHIDEHHTIEDVGIALGEAFLKALDNKRGIERYGFLLPMDDCLAQVAIDFGGRSWIVWDTSFTREKIGEMPTEMFFHFFKSFSDASRSNLNIKAEGNNEHHKIEAIFKAFAKAVKMAVKRDINNNSLPSTKGLL